MTKRLLSFTFEATITVLVGCRRFQECMGLSSSVFRAPSVFIPNSIKVALGIGNCAFVGYCLVVTQAKHCIVFVCPNAKCPIAKATFIELGYICTDSTVRCTVRTHKNKLFCA